MRKSLSLSLIILSLTACNFPKATSRCAQSHTESKMVYWPTNSGSGSLGITPGGVGIHVGGGWHTVYETVCDAYIRVDTLTGQDIPGSEFR